MKQKFRSNDTLDSKHNEIIKNFNYDKNILLPKYLKEIETLQNNYETNNNNNNEKNNEINESVKNKIIDIKNKIYLIKKKEKEYYLNNSKYLFDYFEKKKDINNTKSNTNTKTKNNLKIQNFFNISDNSNNIYNNNNDSDNDNKKNIDKYFYNINKINLNINNYIYDSEICQNCKQGELIFVETDGISICNNCSNTIRNLIENDKPSYKEPPKEVCFYAYKRINHLREILAQFQAKETTNIPDEVIENLKNQIKKERVNLKDLTNKKTKELLKNLGYNKFYEHIPFIKDKIGIKPPTMSSELEETLCNLFMEIQKPYSKYCPKERVNFLNYYYTLYKLCELLNERSFLPYFPMLKDRDKRIEQDQIWKKICQELDWQFIPTL